MFSKQYCLASLKFTVYLFFVSYWMHSIYIYTMDGVNCRVKGSQCSTASRLNVSFQAVGWACCEGNNYDKISTTVAARGWGWHMNHCIELEKAGSLLFPLHLALMSLLADFGGGYSRWRLHWRHLHRWPLFPGLWSLWRYTMLTLYHWKRTLLEHVFSVFLCPIVCSSYWWCVFLFFVSGELPSVTPTTPSFTTLAPTVRPHSCPEGEFVCGVHGECVDQRRVCDFRHDCSDGSDEHSCGGYNTVWWSSLSVSWLEFLLELSYVK